LQGYNRINPSNLFYFNNNRKGTGGHYFKLVKGQVSSKMTYVFYLPVHSKVKFEAKNDVVKPVISWP